MYLRLFLVGVNVKNMSVQDVPLWQQQKCPTMEAAGFTAQVIILNDSG